MGLYDHLRVKRALPKPGFEDPQVVAAIDWQTKDTKQQYLELYELREDGTLWWLASDREWVHDPTAFLGARQVQSNKRWEQEISTGEIRFYCYEDEAIGPWPAKTWIEFSAYFVNGVLKELHEITQVSASLN